MHRERCVNGRGESAGSNGDGGRSVPQALRADSVTVDVRDPNRLTRAARTTVRWVRDKTTRPPDVRPYLLGELLVVLCLLRVYDLIRGQANVRKDDALRYGAQIVRIEHTLHIGVERTINHWTVRHEVVNYITSYWYQYAHITVTLIVLLWCWRWHPSLYRRFRNTLVLINVVGLTVFLLLPVAPPRLLPGAGFVDADRLVGFGSDNVGPVTADAYGAFPSLHIAWAVWTAVLAYTILRQHRFSWLILGYPFITLFVIVATGNHYVLDAVAGAVLALAALKVVAMSMKSPRPMVSAPVEQNSPAHG